MAFSVSPAISGHSIEISEKNGVRYLHFGSEWIQGAMRLQRPNALELAYSREMMTGLLFHVPPWPRKALMIGLGAGSLARFLCHKSRGTEITVVEIDPQVEIIARLYFKLPDDADHLKIVIGDGADYLPDCGMKFDAIFVDGFDRNGSPGLLDTLSFYRVCHAHLTENGLMSVNLLGQERFEESAQAIATAFDGRSLVFPSCHSGNAIALAAAGRPVDISFEELSAAATAVHKKTGLNLLPILPRLQNTEKRVGDRLIL
jgi:spermidine synthase